MDILKEAWVLDSLDRDRLAKVARKHIKDTAFAMPTSIQLWEAYRELLSHGMARSELLENALRVKDVRTDSGVAPITVLTKPFPCPGRCVYCPTEARMPKSYISTEPAAARALSLEFDPYEQVRQRVLVLERNGHQANKIELIVKGGTWSAYTADYREWFVKRCFEAANELPHPPSPSRHQMGEGVSLEDEQKINETAAYRIIGLTIETRPDWIKPKEVIHLRKLGVTRVELGLQIINDRVLALTKRGTTVADAERAIALLKTAGFKVDVHILPGQPGASIEDDLESFRLLFEDPRFRPDMIKLYPCVVLPESELAEWTARGEFKPLQGDELRELLITMQTMIPRYCRVSRMIRDFPTTQITHGNKQSNLRESLETEMKKRGLRCVCLRCREVAHVSGDHTQDKTKVFEERYENAGGTEVFLSIENEDRSAVFGFCRLRLPEIPLNLPLTRETSEAGERGSYLRYDQNLIERARGLRNFQTPAEQKLWNEVLCEDKTGYRFLRQKPLDHFIVDFYCSKLALAIEVDDPLHEQNKEYDDARTAKLEVLGLKIIRFTNYDVKENIDLVRKNILDSISSQSSHSPLSKGDGGISDAFPVLEGAAIIRELHTYGTALNINQKKAEASQHKGYGRLLMQTAEDIARREGFKTMAVISGIGVREYYKNLGYEERDTYMAKTL